MKTKMKIKLIKILAVFGLLGLLVGASGCDPKTGGTSGAVYRK